MSCFVGLKRNNCAVHLYCLAWPDMDFNYRHVDEIRYVRNAYFSQHS